MAILKFKDMLNFDMLDIGIKPTKKIKTVNFEQMFKDLREQFNNHQIKIGLGDDHPARKGIYKGRGAAFGDVQIIGRGMRHDGLDIRHIRGGFHIDPLAGLNSFESYDVEFAKLREKERVASCMLSQFIEERVHIARELIATIPNSTDVTGILLKVHSIGINTDKNSYETRMTTKHYYTRVAEMLYEIGFKLLGTGAFSTVFEYDSRVFKLNSQQPYKVDGWYGYAMNIMGSTNPMFMKVHNIQNSDALYCAEVEKLVPVEYPESICPYDWKIWLQGKEASHITRIMHTMGINRRDAIELITVLNRVRMETTGTFDVHGHNIMKRGDTLVITDPIAHAYFEMDYYA